MTSFKAFCAICEKELDFDSPDDYWSCRGSLRSSGCGYGSCATRERALGSVLLGLVTREALQKKTIYESSPAMRGFTLWLMKNCPGYHPTGFFINQPFGTIVNGIQNENLEQLTLPDDSVDIWLHLDVLEHLFDPFLALREIFRTLKAGGLCVFTAPTYPERVKSEQVAWQLPNGSLKIIGEPEYHGNPQHPEKGALVTWRYGYDLPLLIQRNTGFDVEVRRWQSREIAVMGTMTEVYICRKPT
jgi:SAM-dependent methyltransferase